MLLTPIRLLLLLWRSKKIAIQIRTSFVASTNNLSELNLIRRRHLNVEQKRIYTYSKTTKPTQKQIECMTHLYPEHREIPLENWKYKNKIKGLMIEIDFKPMSEELEQQNLRFPIPR